MIPKMKYLYRKCDYMNIMKQNNMVKQLSRLVWGDTTYPYTIQYIKPLTAGLSDWINKQEWSKERIDKELNSKFQAYLAGMLILRAEFVMRSLLDKEYKPEDAASIRNKLLDEIKNVFEPKIPQDDLLSASGIYGSFEEDVLQRISGIYTLHNINVEQKVESCDNLAFEDYVAFCNHYHSGIVDGYIPSDEIRDYFIERAYGLLKRLETFPSNKRAGWKSLGGLLGL